MTDVGDLPPMAAGGRPRVAPTNFHSGLPFSPIRAIMRLLFLKTEGILMELRNGRPEDFASRLPKEQRVYELLDSLGIDYQRVDHEPAMTM